MLSQIYGFFIVRHSEDKACLIKECARIDWVKAQVENCIHRLALTINLFFLLSQISHPIHTPNNLYPLKTFVFNELVLTQPKN